MKDNENTVHTIKKILGRLKRKADGKLNNHSDYLTYYLTLPINEKGVLLESQNGKKIDGSIYYLVKELLTNDAYEGLEVFISADTKETADRIRRTLSRFDTSLVKIVIVGSDSYYRALASVKYLVNDATFKNSFIKKEGQVYLNTWHGTPLKHMGRKIKNEPDAPGNVMKNFVEADYIMFPNEYTCRHMIEDYMLEGICSSQIIFSGYPRNEAFFDEQSRYEIRKHICAENERVYIYMPTWRQSMEGSKTQQVLSRMDEELTDSEVMYAKLHPLARGSIDFGNFRRIREFPSEYETYEFLNIADCLITDYSSVFYDFAVTGRSIVLYTFDEKEYLRDRGLYTKLEELPFPKTTDIKELMELARVACDDCSYEGFRSEYCRFDSASSAENLCKVLFNQETVSVKKGEFQRNNGKNLFIYSANLTKNEEMDELVKMIRDKYVKDRRCFITYNRNDVKENPMVFGRVPDDISYFGCPGKMNMTGLQKKAEKDYKEKQISFNSYLSIVEKAFECEILRNYGHSPIHEVRIMNCIDPVILIKFAHINGKRFLHLDDNNLKTLETWADKEYTNYIKKHYEILTI